MQTLATFRIASPPGWRTDRLTAVLGLQPTTVHKVDDLVRRRSSRRIKEGL